MRLYYNSDNKNFDEIARLIEQDPVVMARTLKLVNSAFFTIRQARLHLFMKRLSCWDLTSFEA